MYKVALPWYDLEVVRPLTDSFWTGLREHLINERIDGGLIPEKLDRNEHYSDQWMSDKLLISQACGYDLVSGLNPKIQIIGSPVFSLNDVPAGSYFSYIISSQKNKISKISDFTNKVVVVNSKQSHSGRNALVNVVASEFKSLNIFKKVIVSGSHEKSIQLIQSGVADLASIDCITFNILLRYSPEKLKGIRIIQQTPMAYSPPYVISNNCSEDLYGKVKKAFRNCFNDPSLSFVCEGLFLKSIVFPEVDSYLPMLKQGASSLMGRLASHK